jgi:hypothetical protein
MCTLYSANKLVSTVITPLLISFLPFEGPDVRGAVSVGHSRVVVRDTADSSSMAVLVQDATLFFEMPCLVTEQALVDVCTVVDEVARFPTPVAVCVVFIGAMLPPIHEVIEPCIEYSLGDIYHCWDIVEDMWLKVVESIGSGQGMQGVILLPLSVIILFLNIGQLLGQVSDPVVHALEALYFSTKGFIPFLLDSKVDHGSECLCGVEGVSFLLSEDPLGV